MTTPSERIRPVNEAPVRPERRYVLYWMVAARRAHDSFALDHALSLADELGKPLVVLEALRVGYRWASERLHRFVLDGMADNRAAFAGTGVRYWAYVEPAAGEGSGLLEALAADACAVVTDDYPAFFVPRMVEAAGRRLDVRLEAVDGNGLYPMRAADRVFTRAFSFRRHLQKEAPPHLHTFPSASPLDGRRGRPCAIPDEVRARWPEADDDALQGYGLSALPIDHDVHPVDYRGGSSRGKAQLDAFFEDRFDRYADRRNHPDDDGSSGLSPWLHFGHVSSHQVWRRMMADEGWSKDLLPKKVTGQREGFWQLSAPAEAFFDELVTWRELGFNLCAHRKDYDRYESLPQWARATLAEHAKDQRPHVYSLEAFEKANTHDELWNAAQRQLVAEGRIQNYLRMLWGKKILEWTASPEDALAVMIELNNKYAVDGRDPNSYSGIFWVLGRYDRAWGPERKIYGKVRYMTSDSTRRKLRLKKYLARWGTQPSML